MRESDVSIFRKVSFPKNENVALKMRRREEHKCVVVYFSHGVVCLCILFTVEFRFYA